MPKGRTRVKTKYDGVIYYESSSRVTGKAEKKYYVRFKLPGYKNPFEELAGAESKSMTPAKANNLRMQYITGKRLPKRLVKEQEAEKERNRAWTNNRLWQHYGEHYINPRTGSTIWKSEKTDKGRYDLHVREPFGDRTPGEIQAYEFDEYKHTLMVEKGLGPSAARNVLQIIVRMGNYALQKQLGPGLSFKPTMPKVKSNTSMDLRADRPFLDPDELKVWHEGIVKVGHQVLEDTCKFILVTGLRIAETYRLRWEHINYDKNYILLMDTKGSDLETIPLNPEAKQMLEEIKERQKEYAERWWINRATSEYVFPGRMGQQRTSWSYQTMLDYKKHCKLRVGFPPFHGLRHTYATILASNGESLQVIQRLLRHKDPATTQIYAKIHDEALRKAAKVGGELGKANA